MKEDSKLKVKWWHIEALLGSFCFALTFICLVHQEWIYAIISGVFAFIFTIKAQVLDLKSDGC